MQINSVESTKRMNFEFMNDICENMGFGNGAEDRMGFGSYMKIRKTSEYRRKCIAFRTRI